MKSIIPHKLNSFNKYSLIMLSLIAFSFANHNQVQAENSLDTNTANLPVSNGLPLANPSQSITNNDQSLNLANERFVKAKNDLTQAKKVLTWAKANLKASLAEYKAAQSNQTATALTNSAKQIASSVTIPANMQPASMQNNEMSKTISSGNSNLPINTPVSVGTPTNNQLGTSDLVNSQSGDTASMKIGSFNTPSSDISNKSGNSAFQAPLP